jgi:hypothetical protein
MLAFIIAVVVSADFQSRKIRELMNSQNIPSFVKVIDGVQIDTYAFTDPDLRSVYIDMKRFECCPNSFINVVNHELAHTRGREHNNVIGDIMNYSLTVDKRGNIIDDNYIVTKFF